MGGYIIRLVRWGLMEVITLDGTLVGERPDPCINILES